MNNFGGFLKNSQAAGGRLRSALIDVADTTEGCKKWFDSHNLTATAADIVAMTRLVVEREAALKAPND